MSALVSPVVAISLGSLLDDLKNIDARGTLGAIRALISEPTSNLPLALLLVAVLSLVLLVLVMGLLLALAPKRTKVVKVRRYRVDPTLVEARSRGMFSALLAGATGVLPPPRPTTPPAGDSRPKPRKTQRPPSRLELILATPAAAAILIAVALIGTYWSTSTDSYCAETCHSSDRQVTAAHKIDHASCTACHERSGSTGVLANVASRSRMLVSYAMGSNEIEALPIASRSCYRCHRDISDRVSTSSAGVRVSHKEIIAAGYPCTACHDRSGHTRRAYSRGMSQCLACHDGEQASASCSTCHVSNPANRVASAEGTESVGAGDMVYPVVNAARRECGGCHDLSRTCDPCHGGVRMPHSASFIKGGHAMDAAFEGKTKCWRCHTPQGCNTRCHLSIQTNEVSGHPEGWKQEHAKAPRDAVCPCHALQSKRDTPMCPVCHKASKR